jgi:leukotriene-A4 hydrolase
LFACQAEPQPDTGAPSQTTEPPMTEQPSTETAAKKNGAGGEAQDKAFAPLDAGPDPHSFARPDQVRVVHVGLNWVVDFDAQTLTGDAILLLDRSDPAAPLILDNRDLDLKAVHAGTLAVEPGPQGVPELALDPVRNADHWKTTQWKVDEVDPGLSAFGAPIVIELPAGANAVKLSYAARSSATGLQWLAPEQTAGKKLGFLYSQSQAIHARSWIPTQDSPGVRTTWDAIVITPSDYTAVMAAEQLGEIPSAPAAEGEPAARTRAFRFVMPQPVPAYLLALGVGDLEQRELGPRTAVWAEPSVVGKAADEFADMEAMLGEAEKLYGAYAWGRYDVLVLPPAFPFGGMENPRLTFVTPTLLAGDRSLVAVIAHELAHSWSGNLVTNKTWGDMWLNEGFTVYFERRIVEQIYGLERATIEAVIGKHELLEELTDPELLGTKPEFQKLAQNLRGIDPDEAFSGVPYEKGALLLVALEQAYGREVFDAFLREWFTAHAFGSVQTTDFIEFVERELADKPVVPGKTKPQLESWLRQPGLPASAPEPVSAALDEARAAAQRFAAGELAVKQIQTRGWTPWHWLHFLRSLPDTSTVEQLAALDSAFELSQSSNAEILGEWLTLAAKYRYEPAYARMESFLIEVGRRKFLMPIYRALCDTSEGRKQALKIYEKARPGYHSISRGSLDVLLRVP